MRRREVTLDPAVAAELVKRSRSRLSRAISPAEPELTALVGRRGAGAGADEWPPSSVRAWTGASRAAGFERRFSAAGRRFPATAPARPGPFGGFRRLCVLAGIVRDRARRERQRRTTARAAAVGGRLRPAPLAATQGRVGRRGQEQRRWRGQRGQQLRGTVPGRAGRQAAPRRAQHPPRADHDRTVQKASDGVRSRHPSGREASSQSSQIATGDGRSTASFVLRVPTAPPRRRARAAEPGSGMSRALQQSRRRHHRLLRQRLPRAWPRRAPSAAACCAPWPRRRPPSRSAACGRASPTTAADSPALPARVQRGAPTAPTTPPFGVDVTRHQAQARPPPRAAAPGPRATPPTTRSASSRSAPAWP